MRNKAPLALMEQVVMVLVFALAAVLCIQVFVFSGQTSRRNEAQDRAVQLAQNAAEILKQTQGDHAQLSELLGAGGWWNGTGTYLNYDENWQGLDASQSDQAAYTLHVGPRALSAGGRLGHAEISVWEGETCLFTLPVAWQEVPHG